MRQFETIIVVFLFLFVGVMSIVGAFKFMESDQLKKVQAQYQSYIQKYAQQNTESTPSTATNSVVTVNTLNADLQSATDDGGKSDFDQLQTDLSGL